MRKTILFAALFVLAPQIARADPLTLEAGAFGGGHFFSDTEKLGRPSNAPESNALQHSGLFGFRVGFLLIPRLSLEAELGLVPTQTQNTLASVLTINYRAHLLVNLLTGRVRPFLLAGGGGITASSSNSDVLHEDTKGELHLGAGLAADVGCNWGLRLDGRLEYVRATQGLYFTEDGEIMLGVYGRFGKAIQEKCRK